MQFMLHSLLSRATMVNMLRHGRTAFKPCFRAALHPLAFPSGSRQRTTLRAFQLRQHTCSRSRDRCTYRSSCCTRVRAVENERGAVGIVHLSRFALDLLVPSVQQVEQRFGLAMLERLWVCPSRRLQPTAIARPEYALSASPVIKCKSRHTHGKALMSLRTARGTSQLASRFHLRFNGTHATEYFPLPSPTRKSRPCRRRSRTPYNRFVSLM